MPAETRKQRLSDLGWNLDEPAQRPAEIPPDELFPLDERLGHLLIDVQDYEGYRYDLLSLVSPSTYRQIMAEQDDYPF